MSFDGPFLRCENQIEGFKLHVTHNQRPFTNKIRYTPEVASRPQRLQKDLANARGLAAILEEQATRLCQYKSSQPSAEVDGQSEIHGDTMAITEIEGVGDISEPKESGSSAVEQRIEKVMSDIREHGLIVEKDEKAYEEKKVKKYLSLPGGYR